MEVVQEGYIGIVPLPEELRKLKKMRQRREGVSDAGRDRNTVYERKEKK